MPVSPSHSSFFVDCRRGSCPSGSRTYLKSLSPTRYVVVSRHGVHSPDWGTVPQFRLDTRDALAIAFQKDFDAAIRPVHHPPAEPFAAREILREKPEPDTLYTTAQHEPTGHEHRHSIVALRSYYRA